MVDTCCDPTPIDYVIPANDDAAKSISYILDVCCAAINEGLEERKLEKEKTAPETAEEAPAASKKLRSRRGGRGEGAPRATKVAEAAPEAPAAPKAEPAAETPAAE
ncbi:MAG: 30S ribosomal protein S2, partial [Bacteroidales bacterium]|nr:30S ribosomal protein S2 [Bacteroidales bacterium]